MLDHGYVPRTGAQAGRRAVCLVGAVLSEQGGLGNPLPAAEARRPILPQRSQPFNYIHKKLPKEHEGYKPQTLNVGSFCLCLLGMGSHNCVAYSFSVKLQHFGNVQKSGALIKTPNGRALISKTSTKRNFWTGTDCNECSSSQSTRVKSFSVSQPAGMLAEAVFPIGTLGLQVYE